jgi:hypothetical protein
MARSEARIRSAVWRDGDFTSLPRSTQGLFWMLLSQPDVTLAGVLPFVPGRWSTLSGDDDVNGDLETLEAARLVVVDRGTGEVLIRSFTRHDGVLRSEKTKAGMWAAWAAMFSPGLRARFLDQLEESVLDEAVERGWVTRKALEDALSHKPEDGVSDVVSDESDDGVSPRARAESASEPESEPESLGAADAPRDFVFDGLRHACPAYQGTLTRNERGQLNTAAKQLREVGLDRADPEAGNEIVRRAKRWPLLFGDATMTPTAIVSHWGALGLVRANGQQKPQSPECDRCRQPMDSRHTEDFCAEIVQALADFVEAG